MPFLDQWQVGKHGGELADAVAYGNGRFVMVAGDKLAWWSLDGVQWSPVPTDVCLHAITFGHGVFVAVGDRLDERPSGDQWQMAVAVSTDGQTWTELAISDGALPDELGFSGVGYGDGLFVAVGPRGRIYTSSEPAIHWQAQLSRTSADLRGVGFGEGAFVVVGEQGTVLVSEDHGVTWNRAAAPIQDQLRDLAYGKGTFIIIGAGRTILRSLDRGQSWETVAIEAAGELRCIAYGHEAFVIVGEQVITSHDGGQNWHVVGGGEPQPMGVPQDDSARGDQGGSQPLTSVTYGQHRFVAVGPHGRLFQSERATAQLKLTLGSQPDRGEAGKETELVLTVINTGPDLAPDLYADLALNGDFGIAAVQPSRGGYAMINSTTLRYGVGGLRAGEQATVKVVLLPQSRGVIELSADVWADVHLPDPAGQRTQKMIAIEAPPLRPVERWLPRMFEPHVHALRAAAFGDGLWTAVGDHGLITSSWDDGESWVAIDPVTDRSLRAVSHGPEGFVAVGSDGITLWSRDARHWETRELRPAIDLFGLACGSDCAVAVGDKGTILAREFGSGDWQPVLTPTREPLRAITHGGHHFTAVGDHGTVLESPDGWAWSLIPCEDRCDLRCVAHGRENMVIAAADGSVLSQGPQGWERVSCGGAKALHGVCQGGGEYLAVGDGIFTSKVGSLWDECNAGQIGSFYGSAYGNGSFIVVGPQGMIMQSLPVAPPADLRLTVQSSPEVRRGQILRSHLTVVNHGPGPAARVTMTALIPAGAAFAWVNAVHGHCRPIGGVVYCELGEIPTGNGVTVVVGIKPLVLGLMTMQAVVSAIGYDPDLVNNRAHWESEVVARGPALSIDQRAARDQGRLQFGCTIRNDGPEQAYEVTLTDPLPQGTTFLSASTSQGLFIVPKHGQHGAVVCQIGTIEAGERVQVRIQAGLDDRSLRQVTNTVNIEATNAKTVSSTAVVRLK